MINGTPSPHSESIQRRVLLACSAVMILFAVSVSLLSRLSLAAYALPHALVGFALIVPNVLDVPKPLRIFAIAIGILGVGSALALIVGYLPYLTVTNNNGRGW
jgi:hypothetical protein